MSEPTRDRHHAAKLLAESVGVIVAADATLPRAARAAVMDAYVAQAEAVLVSYGFTATDARVLALAWVVDAAKQGRADV